MAIRNHPNPPAELVEEIDSVFERGAHWVGRHPQLVLAAIAAIVAIAAVIGVGSSLRGRADRQAEAEIAGVYDAYLAAMGATPGARDVPEPANPELARRTRAEFAAKLLAAADAHGDRPAAVYGRLQAAELLEKNGDPEGAFAARKLAAEQAPPRSGVAAIALTRYAVGLEAKGDLEGAAEAFARAGEARTPGRALALADAARCHAQLGNAERALALYAEAEKAGIDVVPRHVRQRLEELRAQTSSEAPGV